MHSDWHCACAPRPWWQDLLEQSLTKREWFRMDEQIFRSASVDPPWANPRLYDPIANLKVAAQLHKQEQRENADLKYHEEAPWRLREIHWQTGRKSGKMSRAEMVRFLIDEQLD